MADAMLNPSFRESTLPPLPLPAALPSVGSFAPLTPAPESHQSSARSVQSDCGPDPGGGVGVGEPKPRPASAEPSPQMGPASHSPVPPQQHGQPQHRHGHAVARLSLHIQSAPRPMQPPPHEIRVVVPPDGGPGPAHSHGRAQAQNQNQAQHQHQHQRPLLQPQPRHPGAERAHAHAHAHRVGSSSTDCVGVVGVIDGRSPMQQGLPGPPPVRNNVNVGGGNTPPPPPPNAGNAEAKGHARNGASAVNGVNGGGNKPIEKTVVINLPPEAAERARDALDRHAAREEAVAQVVRGINFAISPRDRNRALQKALASFDHGNPAMHDGEIAAGADAALTKHLALLLLKQQQQAQCQQQGKRDGEEDKDQQQPPQQRSPHGSPHFGPMNASSSSSSPSSSSHECEELCEELTNVCEALEMVYRCSAERVQESYDRVGSELLPMLVGMVERDLGKRRRALMTCAAQAAAAASASSANAAEEEEKERREQQQSKEQQEEAAAAAAAAAKGKGKGEQQEGQEKTPGDESAAEKRPGDDHDAESSQPAEKKRKVSVDHTHSSSAPVASASAPAAARRQHSQSGEDWDYVSPTRNRRLRKITKVFGHFARVGALTQPLAYYPGLLSTLKHVVDLPTSAAALAGASASAATNSSVGAGVAVPREAKLNCLWILANLACNAENMVMMACQPGLIALLVRTARRPVESEEDDYGDIDQYMECLRSRSISVRALLNLSWAPENKLLLSEQPYLVDALTAALMYRASTWAGFGRGVSGMLLQTRRLAAGALRNLAAAPIRNKIRLCRAGGGALLDKLCDAAGNDPDGRVREKAVATVHNLACADTARGFVERPALLEVIADVAVYDGGEGTNLASRTLRVLERSITEDMEEYKVLRPLLDRVAAEREENRDCVRARI